MDYDYKRAVQIVNDFRKLLNDVSTILNICSDKINEADKAFGDIRHLCELEYPKSRAEKTKVCQAIREFSVSRRKAKDVQEVLKPLAALIAQDKRLIQEIGRTANEMKKIEQHVAGERKYQPRVLKELFEK